MDSSQPQGRFFPIGFWFIFFGEFAERCSYYGMRAILALYMIDKLGASEANAGTYVSLFIGACYFMPLVGGWIADNYLGKYRTIVLFSIPYVAGQLMIGVENWYFVLGSLTLLAMGSGVIKPNISTLMGLTFDQKRPGNEKLLSSAFSAFYFAINVGALLSQFYMPRIRSAHGYQVAFLFPAVLMAVALAVFAIGKPFYAVEKIERKVLTPEAAAADRKQKLAIVGRLGGLFVLVLFFWAAFDQHTTTWIFFAKTYMDGKLAGYDVDPDQVQAFNGFFILVFLPISVAVYLGLNKLGVRTRATDKMTVGFLLTGVSCAVLSYAGFNSGTAQPTTRMVFPGGGYMVFPAPPGTLAEIKPDAETTTIGFGSSKLGAADWKYDATKKKATFGNGKFNLPDGKVMVVANGRIDLARSKGLVSGDKVIAPGAMEWAYPEGKYVTGPGKMLVVTKNNAAEAQPDDSLPPPEKWEPVTVELRDWVPPDQRVSLWWQVLACLIITWGEILISVTGLELAFTAAPASMKGFVTGCWLAVVGVANMFVNAPVAQLYPLVSPGEYFGGFAGAMLIVTLVFVFIAQKFNAGTVANPVPVSAGGPQQASSPGADGPE